MGVSADPVEEAATAVAMARVDTVVAMVAMVATAEEAVEMNPDTMEEVVGTARVGTVVATARVGTVVDMVVTAEEVEEDTKSNMHIKGIRGTDEIDDERFLHTRTYTIHPIYARQ